MKQNETKLSKLLYKYLNDMLTEDESKLLNQWFDDLQSETASDPVFTSEITEQHQYDLILKNIHQRISAGQRYPKVSRYIPRMITTIAGAIIIFFLAAGLFYYNSEFKHPITEAGMQTIVVAARSMKLVELPDGTKIWLNSKTKLKFPEKFSTKLREVYLLEGEAFFDVAHDSKRPFIVHSKGINTQVLGTSFNINAYNYSKAVKVSVSTGKVGVSRGKKLIDFLMPNQEIKFQLASKKTVKKLRKAALETSWISGDVVLDQADFETLGVIVRDNFGYELKYKDIDMKQLHFSATLKKNDRIDKVMDLLCAINQTKYTITDKTITMY